MLNINWSKLPHCPDNQLVQGSNSTDAGYDIRIAKSVLVRSYSSLEAVGSYTWEILEKESNLDIPELKDSSAYVTLFTGEGSYKQKVFNSLYGDYEYLQETIELYSSYCFDSLIRFASPLEKREGFGPYFIVLSSEFNNYSSMLKKESYILRKKYKPTLVPTGIRISPQSLAWCAVAIRSGMSKYGIALSNSLGVIDMSFTGELMLPLYSLNHDVPFIKGERVAQLIPMYQHEVNMQVVESIGDIDTRTGFGSTGIK